MGVRGREDRGKKLRLDNERERGRKGECDSMR